MYLLSVQNFLKNIFHWFKRKCVKNYESNAKILENFLMSQDVMRHKLVEMIIIILINIIFFFLYFHWNIMNLEKKKKIWSNEILSDINIVTFSKQYVWFAKYTIILYHISWKKNFPEEKSWRI